MGAVARRPLPSLRALLFRCGERALCEPCRLEDRSWRPWPAGPVRPSCRTLLFWRGNRAVCKLWQLEDRSDSQLSYRFRKQREAVGAVARRPGPSLEGPACFGVASAPCLSLGGWKTAKRVSFLVGAESDVRH